MFQTLNSYRILVVLPSIYTNRRASRQAFIRYLHLFQHRGMSEIEKEKKLEDGCQSDWAVHGFRGDKEWPLPRKTAHCPIPARPGKK
jgi:hypothetical protein